MIEVLDARFIEETRNEEVESKVEREGKALIIVANKADLVEGLGDENKITVPDGVLLLSSRDRHGLKNLRERIMIERKRIRKEKVVVGVLGYPNTGKSSVINALKGRGSARTSPKSGFTLGAQNVKVNKIISMVDTPGVIPFGEDDEVKHAVMGAKNPEVMDSPEDAAEVIISKFGSLVKAKYGCEPSLEKIAEKLGRKLKGGEPDLRAASINIIHDWQRGKLGKK